MSFPLQNHPGTYDVPLRFSLEMLRQGGSRLQNTAGFAAALIAMSGLMFGLSRETPHGAFYILTHAQGNVFEALAAMTYEDIIFTLIMQVVPFLIIVLAVTWLINAARRPIIEQRLYYRLRGLSEPSERQRRVLRCGAAWNYQKQIWPLTLEYWPMGRDFTPRQWRKFRTFTLQDDESERNQTASDWGILNSIDTKKWLDEILEDGVHSQSFAINGNLGTIDYLETVAAIADVALSDVMACLERQDGRPPQLVWGFDLVRAHHMARSGYMSEYLTEAEALDYLERITDCIVTLFPTEEEFLTNLRIGFAVWAGPERRQEGIDRAIAYRYFLFDTKLRDYVGPWPTAAKNALSRNMATGFQDIIDQYTAESDSE